MQGTLARATSFATVKVHVTMGVGQGSVEGPLCFVLLYALSVTLMSTLQVGRLLWAKKWRREEAYPVDKRTSAGEAMRVMVFGRLSFEQGQAPPSRFVRQFLGDLNALRAAAWYARENDPAFKDARTAAQSLGIDHQHDTPTREQQWWKWLLVPATSIHISLSYTQRRTCTSPHNNRDFPHMREMWSEGLR